MDQMEPMEGLRKAADWDRRRLRAGTAEGERIRGHLRGVNLQRTDNTAGTASLRLHSRSMQLEMDGQMGHSLQSLLFMDVCFFLPTERSGAQVRRRLVQI